MGRKSLIVTVLLMAVALQLFAQDGIEAFDFTENRGQWNKEVRYRGDVPAGAFYLHNNGFTVVQHNGDDLDNFFHRHHQFTEPGKGNGGITRPDRGPGSKPGQPGSELPIPPPTPIRSHAYRVYFVGANENSLVVPDKQVQTSTSYFIGNDPSKWAANVPVYQAILYKDIYPNIDIRYYSAYGRLKYDIIVHPGGDPNQVVMRYEGAEKLSIKKNELVIKTSVGDLREMYPYSYQFDMTNGKKEVACAYDLADSKTVRFKLAGYSKTATLVIDPTLVWCSFTGSAANQYGYTATPGPDGSLYSGGIVFGQGFPTTPGAYQSGYGGGDDVNDLGGIDMGIFKFTPDGKRAYATYLGGSRNDYPHSLYCDPSGNLVVMGKTYSSNWVGPLVGPGGGADIALAKLNATGTALIGALRIGGSANDGVNVSDQIQNGADLGTTMRFYGDDSRSEVILDGANNIYVAAQTQSTSGSGLFPVTTGAFQTTPGGGQDGVVMKINPNCTSVIWASFLGGGGSDGAFVLALNPANNELYVGGATTSGSGFPPASKPGAYQSGYQGGVADGFVSRIANNGSTILNTTFLGTGSFDAVYGLKFDKTGIPYAMGVTEGNWPVINVAYSNANSKQFVVKIKPDLSGLIYSTVFGNGSAKPNISPVAFLVDRCENIYISGWGGWIQAGPDPFQMGGVGNMPITPDAIKKTTDNRDFYFIVIKRDAAELLYATYFGQSGGEGEHVDGGTSRYDEQGIIYQAICANCFGSRAGTITQSFPTTPGVWAERNGSRECNLAAVKIAFNFAGVASGPKAYFNGRVDTVGCAPFTVDFRDTVRNAKTYEWDFNGDGVTDLTTDTYEASHTFQQVGNYRVRLIAVDETSCNQRDTAYVTIRVRNDPANIDFDAVKDGPCESLGFNFINKSTAPPGKPFGPEAFAWDFGDGTPIVPTNTDPVKHYFTAPGTYPIRLILLDTNYCNGGDWKAINLGVVANVEARVETPPTGCAPYEAFFNNTSLGGHTYHWDFGDGTTSSEMSPTHLYQQPGPYDVRLTVEDSNTCNKVSTYNFTIRVYESPTAAISHTPATPQVNKPTVFQNNSFGAVRYHWDFGDGDTLLTTTQNDVSHQYNATGEYKVLMTAYNQYGCSAIARDSVQSLIDPLLDVPNAFTPGRGNRTSVVKVAGFGIEKMTWRIYNRWGQKVFETTDRQAGWDGTFQGRLQPMDVYTYTLDVVFTDGRPLRKTGDITLIR